jgi:hypothetical protein
MYVHRAMRDSMRIWDHYQQTIEDVSWLFSGTENAYENWVGYKTKEKRHAARGELGGWKSFFFFLL